MIANTFSFVHYASVWIGFGIMAGLLVLALILKRFVKFPRIPGIQAKTFKNIITGTLLVIVAAWVGLWVYHIVFYMGMPQVEYSEGLTMWTAKLFGTGEWHWNALIGPPFLTSFYTPVWYYITGGLIRIFGLSLDLGRIFAIFCTIGCMYFIFLIVKRFSKSNLFGGIAALLIICNPYLTNWTIYARPDMLADLFGIAGLWVVVRHENSRSVFWAIPLFVLAFYTKQSIVVACFASTVYLFLKDTRLGITFALAFILIVGIIFAAATWATSVNFFKEIITYQQVVKWDPFKNVMSMDIVLFLVFTPMAIISVWYTAKHIRSLPAIFFLSALVINTGAYFHTGGAVNYFYELFFAMAILTGMALPELIRERRLLYLGFFVVFIFTFCGNTGFMQMPDPGYPARVKQGEAIIADATYPVLTENIGLVLSAGKTPYEDPFVYYNLANLGYFNESVIINDLESNRIQYVVTQFDLPHMQAYRFDLDIQEAIVANYHIVYDSSQYNYGFVVYEANNLGGK